MMLALFPKPIAGNHASGKITAFGPRSVAACGIERSLNRIAVRLKFGFVGMLFHARCLRFTIVRFDVPVIVPTDVDTPQRRLEAIRSRLVIRFTPCDPGQVQQRPSVHDIALFGHGTERFEREGILLLAVSGDTEIHGDVGAYGRVG
jgi:hypothetical protein